MSRKYEGLIVLNTKGMESSIDELVSSIGKELEAEGAKLDEVKQMGRREFAYPSKKSTGGHYIQYFFAAEPAAIEKIQGRLRLNDAVQVQHYQTL
jgi:small subunit ribosomal protein S6